jgi:hypothetical protein
MPLAAGGDWIAWSPRHATLRVRERTSDGSAWRDYDVPAASDVQVTCLAMMGDDMAAGGEDGRLVHVTRSGRARLISPPRRSPVLGVALTESDVSPVIIALYGDGTVVVHDLPDGRVSSGAQLNPWPKLLMAAARRTGTFVTASIGGEVVERDALSFAPRRQLTAGPGVRALAVSADGTRLATALDEVVTIWDTSGAGPPGKPLASLRTKATAIALTGDGGRLVSAAENGEVRLWDVAAARTLCRFTLDQPARRCAVSERGEHVFALDAGTDFYSFDVIETEATVSRGAVAT